LKNLNKKVLREGFWIKKFEKKETKRKNQLTLTSWASLPRQRWCSAQHKLAASLTTRDPAPPLPRAHCRAMRPTFLFFSPFVERFS
jgi:hypothetical protein